MAEKHDHTLKDVIERILKAYRWETKLDEAKLINSWESIVGKIIARHTTGIKVNNRILYVNLDSSVIRNELMMSRTKIIEKINTAMGGKVIDEMVLR
jgi:predicted nucleic acid-binding Zn ribbon protein